MAAIHVYVMTSHKYAWAIQPFAYLFNIFWSTMQPVTIVTDVLVEFDLPQNFAIRSMNGNQPLPKEKWSDGFIVMLKNIPEKHFVLLLDDYWLIKTIDHVGIQTLSEYCRTHAEVLRMDLTDDRQFNGHARDIGAYGHYDLVETPGDSEYQMSLQAGIWNRDLLLSLMRPDLSPWEVELYLSPALHDRDDIRVIGTKQCPVRYANVFRGGEIGELRNLEKIPKEHMAEIQRRGWLTQR